MPAFGLDIGSTSIKVVQLSQTGKNFSLVAAGITSSPAKGLESENIQDMEVLAQTIKKLVSDTKINTPDVAISMPESKVYTRLMNKLPLLTDEEVASAIAWQAEPYIPIPIEQASLSYQIVQRNQPQGSKPGSTEVLLVAAEKDLVKRYNDLAAMAGLNLVNVTSEMSALSGSLSIPSQTVLVADIGATSCDFGIVRSGQLLVSRSVATGGNVLTRAVMTNLSVDNSRAEEYKKSYGLSAQFLEGRVRSALEPVVKVIAEEAKKTIQYYKSDAGKDDQVSAMVISGGTAGIPDGAAYFANEVGLEVSVGDPFSQIAKNEQTAKSLSAWTPLYGIAVGLAKESFSN